MLLDVSVTAFKIKYNRITRVHQKPLNQCIHDLENRHSETHKHGRKSWHIYRRY